MSVINDQTEKISSLTYIQIEHNIGFNFTNDKIINPLKY